MDLGLGFKAYEPRTTWIGRGSKLNIAVTSDSKVRRRQAKEWHQQWQLARKLYPEGIIWPYPLNSAYFHQRGWKALGMGFERHWVRFEQQRLIGSLSLRLGLEPGTLRLILMVDEDFRGSIESELISGALSSYPSLSDVIQFDYPTGVADADIRRLGFSENRKLIWMQLNLSSVQRS
jgi:hypothetical protein